ncbi:DUF1284 domain-containing protein [Clostridium sp. SHJSY1]|uniref:DUF1284 domain-containing protein n=1 Tax=Clostridium sp. SHJSY1 TaxID=2942483 RepID=UPI002875EB91|nr:DUF1284 domain-containing protein [Clostridium sp. SHJSY1]MDS0524680.1 DUF1284 domain-containing protein [Clostridium sp. SHJSY1]
MLKIRPHHINCIYFYRGLGYSKEFVKGMDNIVNLLKEDDNIEIKLINHCDDICENCPNKLKEQICKTNNKIKDLDELTLKEYGLKIDNSYKFSYIKRYIYKNFSKEKFEKICKDCDWHKNKVCAL